MPTYQYACTDCGHRFEAVQSFSDDSLTECPQCSGRLRKLFGAVGVVFKGSGFYRTDSRSEAKSGTKNDTKSTGESSSSGGSTGETAKKTDSSASSDSGGSSSSGSSSGATKAAS